MRKINTSCSSGDNIILKDGRKCKVGVIKKIDNKNLIALHFQINSSSGVTEYVSTAKLNKMFASNIL
jgi:hypothetical protein